MPNLGALADFACESRSGHNPVLHLFEAGSNPVNKKATLLDSLDGFAAMLKRETWPTC